MSERPRLLAPDLSADTNRRIELAVKRATDGVIASGVSFTPAANIEAENVQAAIEELDAEKQPLHANLTAFAGLPLVTDRLPYANGAGTLALATFTAAGRALLDDADASAQRTTLGLGTAALAAVGTSGDALGKLNTANTWTGKQTFNSFIEFPEGGRVNFQTGLHFYSGGGVTLEISAQSTGLRIWGMTTTASAANVHYDNALTELLLRSTSAEAYKRDIEPADPAFSFRLVRELEPIWYRSNTDRCPHDNPAHSFWGFSADKAAVIDPRMVSWGYYEEDVEVVLPAKPGEQPTRRPKPSAVLKPTGFNYERMSVHHHLVIRDLLQRIEILERGAAARANLKG